MIAGLSKILRSSVGIGLPRCTLSVPSLAAREDGAAWLKRLRQAALMDEQGIALDGALKTIATL